MNTPAEVMLPDGSSFVMHVDGNTSHWTFCQCDLCDRKMLMEERFVLVSHAAGILWQTRLGYYDAGEPWLCEYCASDFPKVMVHVSEADYMWEAA